MPGVAAALPCRGWPRPDGRSGGSPASRFSQGRLPPAAGGAHRRRWPRPTQRRRALGAPALPSAPRGSRKQNPSPARRNASLAARWAPSGKAAGGVPLGGAPANGSPCRGRMQGPQAVPARTESSRDTSATLGRGTNAHGPGCRRVVPLFCVVERLLNLVHLGIVRRHLVQGGGAPDAPPPALGAPLHRRRRRAAVWVGSWTVYKLEV